ncbi:hypothetical protein A1O7_01907 [Cladophialophora yegresii CBS 114405]|uniref:Uncharacterized protein n=1 Tax=Cladophialophora yegresii CBS 114405 TaxID=1182544 RepID=W9WLQ0_9EURO|nr:uncharacterized protein A1O7_01907 [Cladophialophora yegresii CBS 114405]EXJ65566.1 hypothetical protein A1O7_01907 [Cladophialophora yegresii CBS 114405]
MAQLTTQIQQLTAQIHEGFHQINAQRNHRINHIGNKIDTLATRDHNSMARVQNSRLLMSRQRLAHVNPTTNTSTQGFRARLPDISSIEE